MTTTTDPAAVPGTGDEPTYGIAEVSDITGLTPNAWRSCSHIGRESPSERKLIDETSDALEAEIDHYRGLIDAGEDFTAIARATPPTREESP